MRAVRDILTDEGFESTLKWGKPCFASGAGGNVAILQPMKDALRLMFFQGALLDDPEGRLEWNGPNSRAAKFLAFTSVDDVESTADIIRRMAGVARDNAEAGRRVPPREGEPDLPDEMTEALAGDEGLADAWDDLTPGRRRSWVLHVGGAKQSETRVRRFDKAREAILAGKGWNER
jgi:uncharacterized protein YdeI (YjbR/CyaY-like superfamily)